MQREDLNRFLASVRKTRFIDYLDPIGETALQAFERRLRWAERSRDDAAHVDEATFLLDNADDLREVVRKEMEQEQEDDWVDAVDAGSENVRISKPKAGAMRESLDDRPKKATPAKAQDEDDEGGSEPTPLPGVRAFGPKGGSGGNPDVARRLSMKSEPRIEADDAPAPEEGVFKRGAPARPVPRAAKSEAPPGARGIVPPKAPKAPPIARKVTPTLLPEEPAEGQDPWDLEQTGIMRMEDVTPTPPQARASLPKPTPKAGPSAPKAIDKPGPGRGGDVGRRGTSEADVGWDESAKGAPENAPPPTSPGAVRRSMTPTGEVPKVPVSPIPGGPAAPAGGGPAIMQRRAKGEDSAPAASGGGERRRSRAPMALLGLLVAGGSIAGVAFLLPMLQAGQSTDTDAALVAMLDTDGADSDAVAEADDSDAAEDSDAVAEVEDSDAEPSEAPGVGAVVDAGEPPEADPPKSDPPKVARVDTPRKDPPKADPPKSDPPKADPPKSDPPKADPPKADPPKADPPKADPPAEPVTIAIKGLWTGKIDGRALFLTVTKQAGNIVEATAELQTAEGFMNIALAGTWDEPGQSLSLTGPDGAVFKATGKDGRLNGTATVKAGSPSVSFSVGKK